VPLPRAALRPALRSKVGVSGYRERADLFNEQEASYAETTRSHRERKREENRQLWQEVYERQARSHATMAASYARRAVKITNERSK
jgi:hypothetical protein